MCFGQFQKKYLSNITLFIMYVYKFDRSLLHNSWSSTLDSFTTKKDDEKKKATVLKKTIKKLLGIGKEEAPPLKFEEYRPVDFIKYLLSLRGNEDKRLSVASYVMKRSSLFRLFRLYGFQQSQEFENNMNVYYKGFKRKVVEEVQNGGGKYIDREMCNDFRIVP